MTGSQLSELFARYGDDVYRFAYSFTRHAADAEDVCQSVFCRLAEGRTELEPGKEKAWPAPPTPAKTGSDFCKDGRIPAGRGLEGDIYAGGLTVFTKSC